MQTAAMSQSYQMTARIATQKLQQANMELQQLREYCSKMMKQEDFQVIECMKMQARYLREALYTSREELYVANDSVKRLTIENDRVRFDLDELTTKYYQLYIKSAVDQARSVEPQRIEEQLKQLNAKMQKTEYELADFKTAASTLKIENSYLKKRLQEMNQDIFVSQTINSVKQNQTEVNQLMQQKIDLGQENLQLYNRNRVLEQRLEEHEKGRVNGAQQNQYVQEALLAEYQRSSDLQKQVIMLTTTNEQLLMENSELQRKGRQLEEQLKVKQSALDYVQEQFTQAMLAMTMK